MFLCTAKEYVDNWKLLVQGTVPNVALAANSFFLLKKLNHDKDYEREEVAGSAFGSWALVISLFKSKQKSYLRV
jgi:hypothetical protein